MGAMIFGGVESEKIQVNEKTIWSGGPGEDEIIVEAVVGKPIRIVCGRTAGVHGA